MIAVEFLNPERLWWLLLVGALGIAYIVVQRWRRRATVRFTQVELLDRVAPSRPGWRRHVVAALQLAGLAVGVVAIARPITTTTERTESEGRILVLFDVSLSMMATDVEPDRLEAAKEAARAFVDQVAPDIEVGLISFSGNVAVEVPPTLDRESLDAGIDELELAESTAIGDALATGADLLTRLAEDGEEGESDDIEEDIAPGAMVLLSDGETTVGRPTEEGAQEAADAGVPVFTIAFGTPEGEITEPVSGEIVPVPVRPEPLAEVAETTGGAAYEAATSAELEDAYERIRDSLGETLGEEIEIVNELTWRWAAAALAILTVTWVLALWWLRGLI
jgi:Ca-activated chloride channel homolog